MTETEEYILDAIKTWVWSGFYTPDEVEGMIFDLLEAGVDAEPLRAAVRPEFVLKAEAEQSWPPVTDCDRLDIVFATLRSQRILGLQNAGFTMMDGIQLVYETLHQEGFDGYTGFCFYHGQDMKLAIHGGGLMLAFDHIAGDYAKRGKVGKLVKSELEKEGFSVSWDGSPDHRIDLPLFDWKKRGIA